MAGLIAFLLCDKHAVHVTAVDLPPCRSAEEECGNEGGECWRRLSELGAHGCLSFRQRDCVRKQGIAALA